jgi:hypothetical protein
MTVGDATNRQLGLQFGSRMTISVAEGLLVNFFDWERVQAHDVA